MHVLAFLLASTAFAATSDPEPLEERVAALGLRYPPPGVRIELDKSDRRLEIYSHDTLLKTYRSGLGDPAGDKVRQGDLKTPTGTFRVVTRNPRSRFHLFLGLSYPTTEDADRGLRDGLITAEQARKIREADAAGRVPPWNTSLGGMIGIHGEGGGYDWTLGCIAVDNDEMDELWAVVKHGTQVDIRE
jgi:murein L,D-transpeptidase YafK